MALGKVGMFNRGRRYGHAEALVEMARRCVDLALSTIGADILSPDERKALGAAHDTLVGIVQRLQVAAQKEGRP